MQFDSLRADYADILPERKQKAIEPVVLRHFCEYTQPADIVSFNGTFVKLVVNPIGNMRGKS